MKEEYGHPEPTEKCHVDSGEQTEDLIDNSYASELQGFETDLPSVLPKL